MLLWNPKMLRGVLGVAACVAMTTACGSSTSATEATGDDASGSADTALTGDGTGGTDNDTTSGPNTLLPDGEYYLSVKVVPFGGLLLPFKATVKATGSLADGGKLASLELRAVSEKETPVFVSEPIGTVKDVVVDKGGKFTAEFPDTIIIPGKASPTGSDVHVAFFKLIGTIHDDATFCGDMSGTVVEFNKDVATSTFKAVKFGSQSTPPQSSCADTGAKHYKGIDTCPSLKAGVNTITSAERNRRFSVYLPADASATNLPVVFLFHGVGGSMDGIVGDTNFDALLKTENFILVVPESERDAKGNPVSQTEWAYGIEQTKDDNQDLVFFDDMLKCVGSQWKADSKRIYVTGMSGGGLMTVFTSFSRSDVIAAAAPFSGGYLFKFPSTKNKFPEMVVWGGETDSAYAQNFNKLALDLIPALRSDGHFVIQCNHGTGHKWPAAMTAADWAFLKNYTLGGPNTDFNAPLPAVFPDYCTVSK